MTDLSYWMQKELENLGAPKIPRDFITAKITSSMWEEDTWELHLWLPRFDNCRLYLRDGFAAIYYWLPLNRDKKEILKWLKDYCCQYIQFCREQDNEKT